MGMVGGDPGDGARVKPDRSARACLFVCLLVDIIGVYCVNGTKEDAGELSGGGASGSVEQMNATSAPRPCAVVGQKDTETNEQVMYVDVDSG